MTVDDLIESLVQSTYGSAPPSTQHNFRVQLQVLAARAMGEALDVIDLGGMDAQPRAYRGTVH